MKLTIDTEQKNLLYEENGEAKTLALYSEEAFNLISDAWVKVGWNQKYIYTFTWMGRPIIQLPEDMVRLQEVIYTVKPDVIIEAGVAHGGSLIYYASLCKVIGKGRIIGIDIEIRPHNRKAIEAHELFPYITLIEGSSVDTTIVDQVKSLVKPGETVLVLLDSNHTKAHVLGELRAYAPLVSVGSYIVATDGVMEYVADVPRGNPEWTWDNPMRAADDFLAENPDFVLEEPSPLFNERGEVFPRVTHWPGSYLKRIR